MHVRRLIVLSALAAVVGFVPAATLAGAHGTGRGPKGDRPPRDARPLEGTSTGTNTVNLQTLAGTYESSGHLSHFGMVTGHGVQQITVTGPNTISLTGSGVTMAANGDELFATTSGTGTITPTAAVTTLNTITGGTGRFADARGTFTVTSVSKPISTVGSIETFAFTSTTEGHIDY
jgi:hypothetical protein